MDGSRGSSGRGVSAAGVVLAIVTVILLGIPVAAFIGVRENSDPHRPDIDAISRSAAVASADAAATTDMLHIDAGLNSLPWLAKEATSVVDTCESLASGEFFAKFGPVSCGRSTTYYLAFDGDLLTRTHAIDAAIRQAGWQAPSGGGMPALWKAIPTLGRAAGCRTGRPLDVGDLPTASYEDVYGTTLTVDTWGQRPTPPVWLRDVPTPQSGGTTAVGVRQFRGVNVTRVVRNAYRAHAYVLEIQLQSRYFSSSGPIDETVPGSGFQC